MSGWWDRLRGLFSAGSARAGEIERFAGAWQAKHARTAWRPLVDASDSTTRAWFGGAPLLPEGAEWPACADCGQPMRFFLQLDLAELPAGAAPAAGEGLVQLFYCATDDGDCETWAHRSGATHVRLLFDAVGLTPRDGPEPFERKPIAGWTPFEDAPHGSDFDALGLDVRYDRETRTVAISCADPPVDLDGLDYRLEEITEAASGDKLGGWPYWVQRPEYPQCRQCGATMGVLLQLDSEDHLPWMFGDVGCAHVTQCPHHPDELAFGWACS